MLLLLAACLIQDAPEIKDLRKKIRDLDIDLVTLDRSIEEAFQAKQFNDAERLVRESQEKRREREKLQDELQRKASGPLTWAYAGSFSVEYASRWTIFDHGLGVDHARGNGIEIAYRRTIFVDIRWWQADDKFAGEDARIVEVMLGLENTLRLMKEGAAELVYRISAGRAWMETENGDAEGPFMVSAGFAIKTYWARIVRSQLGVDADLIPTDFNRHRLAWQYALSLRLGVEIGF